MNRIYALYDIVAQAIVGQLMIMKHDAAAIRIFADAMTAKEPNMINQHPEDFRLITLGSILEHGTDPNYELDLVELVPAYRIVLEGKQWLATREINGSEDTATGDVSISLARKSE